MQIKSLLLVRSEPINDIHRRSYISTVSPEAMTQLDTVTQGGKYITQTAISQVASQFIQPSAESEGVANIVNGWQTSRFHFMMNVIEQTQLGGETYEAWYIGHTDYADGSVIEKGGGQLLIDGQLQFYINTVHRLKTQQIAMNGQYMNKQVGIEGSQFIYGQGNLSNIFTPNNNAPMDFKIRPVDVFQSKETMQTMMNHGWISPDDFGPAGIHQAFNSQLTTSGSFITGADMSGRRNNNPGTFLFDTINSYQKAISVTEGYMGDESNVVREAVTLSNDGSAYQDQFFTFLRGKIANIQHTGKFTWNDLVTIAPYVDDVTQVVTNRNHQHVWHAGNTNHWRGSDNETITATLLVNAVPTILMENLGGSIRFTMTNMTLDGSIIHNIEHFTSFSDTMDWQVLSNRVISRIMTELVPKFTIGNQLPFSLVVDCSIVGETMVNISFNGQEPYIYIMPTFADNMVSPVITPNREKYIQFTDDIYRVTTDLLSQNRINPII